MADSNDTDEPAVVLIHSSASSSRQWRALAERLRDRHRVMAPDLCGYGPGEAAGGHGFADDLARVRDTVEAAPGPVHLVGHSYGGVLAAKTAIDRPGLVRSLTLIEPVCFHLLEEAGDGEALAEARAVRDRQVAAVAAGEPLAAARGFVTYWMGAPAWEAMGEERRRAVAGTMAKVVAEWPGAFGPTTRLADYAALPAPTLIMRAAGTTLAARRITDLIREHLGDHTFVEVDRGGHMSPVTNPEPVNGAIARFLAGVTRS